MHTVGGEKRQPCQNQRYVKAAERERHSAGDAGQTWQLYGSAARARLTHINLLWNVISSSEWIFLLFTSKSYVQWRCRSVQWSKLVDPCVTESHLQFHFIVFDCTWLDSGWGWGVERLSSNQKVGSSIPVFPICIQKCPWTPNCPS